MFATLSPTTREFSRQHFAAAAARIESAARLDAWELAYLHDGGPLEDYQLAGIDEIVTTRFIDRNNLLYWESWQNDII
jgi:hypothetical protein